MYLRYHKRLKDGKEHRYWSIVECVRTRRDWFQNSAMADAIACAKIPLHKKQNKKPANDSLN